jgi:hypothetical protein
MTDSLNAIKGFRYGEERLQGASRTTHDRTAAIFSTAAQDDRSKAM